MTRANLNFVWQKKGEAPRTLFHYHNGDQYPTGIRDNFNVLELVSGELTPKRFKEWIKKNYEGEEPEDLGKGGQPKIYYTDGFITDYSYVFDANLNTIIVWNWTDKIFEGTPKKFIEWIKKQK